LKKILLLFLCITAMSIGWSGTVHSASYTYDGNLLAHNDVARIALTLQSDLTNVEIWTDSYNGGVNFDPYVTLWMLNDAGTDYTFVDDSDDIQTEAELLDSKLAFEKLMAGEYIITVTAVINGSPNAPNWNLLSDGFVKDSEKPIDFINISERNNGSYYRLNITGTEATPPNPEPSDLPPTENPPPTDITPNLPPVVVPIDNTAPVPEPSTMILIGLGFLGFAITKRRNK
jgi:hypothetical protein